MEAGNGIEYRLLTIDNMWNQKMNFGLVPLRIMNNVQRLYCENIIHICYGKN